MSADLLLRIITMDHDQHFKNLILDYPRESIALFAESEARKIDTDARVTPVRQEMLKARFGDRYRELDVPLLVQWPDGRREAMVFVIEEETEPRRFSVYRLAQYCLDISQLCNTRRVVPVVVFLHPGPFEDRLELGSDDQTYLQFRFLAFSLPSTPAVAHWDSGNIVARMNLPNMAYPPEAKVDVYDRAVEGLRSLEIDPGRRDKYLDFIDNYADLDENEWAVYRARHAQEDDMAFSSKQKMKEEWLLEGRKEGRQEGRQEGEHAAAVRILFRQLALRFGDSVAESAKATLDAADLEQLLLWSERVLTAEVIEDVFR